MRKCRIQQFIDTNMENYIIVVRARNIFLKMISAFVEYAHTETVYPTDAEAALNVIV